MRFTVSFVLLFLTAPIGFGAESTSAGNDREAFLRTVTQAPALSAAARRDVAARERIGAAGKLADIEVEGMGSRMVGPMDERGTMWELNVRQPLPRRGERLADVDRARAAVSVAEAEYALVAGEIAADSAAAIAEAEGATARVEFLQSQITRLETTLRAVEARIAAGIGRLADRLTLQSRLAELQFSIAEERLQAEDAVAVARSRLGLSDDSPLPPFAAPEPAEIRVADAPAVRMAEARIGEAGAMLKAARASANPMTSVGVRFEQERRPMGDENTVGLAVMTELPWRSRKYARAEINAVTAERSAAQSDATSARYRAAAALTRVERAQRLADMARRLSRDTVRRLHAEHEAMARSASVGESGSGSTTLETVELLEKITDSELQVLRAETALRTARAELWRYLPTTALTKPLR